MIQEENLTQLAVRAIDAAVNVSDGHPRQTPTPSQAAIVDALPELFEEARTTPLETIEARAHEAFFSALGQHAALREPRRILSAYASSVAMDVLARLLASRTSEVGLVHPTFDNIPDLLRAWSLRLTPIEEDDLAAGALDVLERVGALFVTNPNNPTGTCVGAARLAELAEECARRGVILVLDTSFRGFDRRAQYDTYAVLDATDVEYVVIEDTGKLWPVLELKIGFLVASAGVHRELSDALSDIMLNVSPVISALVTRLAADAAGGGFKQLHGLIERNREVLADAIDGSGASLAYPDSRVSVGLVRLPDGVSSARLTSTVRRRGLHVFPGHLFHWARPADGDRFLRIALARDPEVVRLAGRLLADELATRAPAGSAHREEIPRRAAAGSAMRPHRARLPVAQTAPRAGIVDLGPGTTAPELAPAALLADAAERIALDEPVAALTYGANQGAGPTLEWLLDWLPSLYGGAVGPDELLITGGASAALDRLCTHLTRPGDVALMQSPSYHYAAGVLASRGLRLVPVADDGRGPAEDAFRAAIDRLPPRQGRALFYSVPIHGNPTGRTAVAGRWERIYDLARERGITVVHDEVYAPVGYDGALRDCGFELAPRRHPHVARLGSFSKILAPGLRVGWMVGGAELVETIASDGLSQSGGGASHWAAMVVAALCRSPELSVHLAHVADVYRARRDVMAAALEEHMSPYATWHVPAGGFFVWLRLREPLVARALLERAEANGMSFVPGDAFFLPEVKSEGRDALRLSFSHAPADRIEGAVAQLAAACGVLAGSPAAL